VHCQPAGNGFNALKYLAPYIFRVATSNRRILRVEDGRTVTPAGESPGLACDSLQSRSPRAGWRFTCADGLPLAQSAARFPKRCFALIPKWEYNLVAEQYDRLGSARIMRRLRAA
jgi:hypothetical protein